MGPGAIFTVGDVTFTNVSGAPLGADDVNTLRKVTGSRYNPHNGETDIAYAAAGQSSLWLATGPKTRFFVSLEVRLLKSGISLMEVVSVAGIGYLKQARALLPAVSRIAKHYNCAGIGGITTSKGLQKLYDSFGAKEDYRYYVLEI